MVPEDARHRDARYGCERVKNKIRHAPPIRHEARLLLALHST
jgi:hypothetical protein